MSPAASRKRARSDEADEQPAEAKKAATTEVETTAARPGAPSLAEEGWQPSPERAELLELYVRLARRREEFENLHPHVCVSFAGSWRVRLACPPAAQGARASP